VCNGISPVGKGRRKLLFLLTGLCVIGAVGYVIAAAIGSDDLVTDARPSAAAGPLPDAALMVRAVDPHDPRLNGRVFVVRDGRVERSAGDHLACERVYYAAGQGLCLAVGDSGVDYIGTIFDSRFMPQHQFALTGLPSRARVSFDGKYGATTVFVAGHAYLGSSGGFSTTTTIVDMRSGETVAQLEQFEVTKEGQSFDSVDFNFWGVTFTHDSNRFYATLGTGGDHYLVEGNIRDRTLRVLRDGVECPSLSPDGKRVAYKSRIGGQNRWRLRVLDLSTLNDHGVAETRSIDDQVEWLDEGDLVYSDGEDVFTVPADGSGEARLLVEDATSPVSLVPR
jgi:hypothetical protein